MKDVDRGPIAAIVTWWTFQLPVAVVDDGTPFYTILEQKTFAQCNTQKQMQFNINLLTTFG